MKRNVFCSGLLALAIGIMAPLASYGYCPDQGKTGWIITNELLIWTAHQDGLGFTTKPADVLTTTDFTQNGLVHPKYQWDYGFRFGLAYTTCDRGWTFDLNWANIENHAKKHVGGNSGAPDFEGRFPVWSMSPDTLPGDYVSTARSNWHLHTNLVDLNAQYNFCWGERLLVMPFFGVRFASLTQKLSAKYAGGTFFSGVDINRLRSRFYGGGPRLGFNAEYYLMNGFSLDGMFAVDTLWGQYKITQKEEYLGATRLDRENKETRFLLGLDYSLGLSWVGNLCESFPKVTLSAAYEGHLFFHQNRFPRGPYGFFKRDRNLMLHGATLAAAIDF